MKNKHTSVLLEECIDALSIKPGGVYIDGTFGRGGHSGAILAKLNENGRLIAIDKDMDAVTYGRKQFSDDPRVSVVHGSFSQVAEIVERQHLTGSVDGILLDLGVSSPQLDEAQRGFSFMKDGPLDMRMDTTQAMSAETWLQEASWDEMAMVFKKYGEERFAKKIAKAIEQQRLETPFTRTSELASFIEQIKPKQYKKTKHPATQVFQAIRIFINQELQALEVFLDQCLDVLGPKGRLAVISFHSLEDRIVKLFMREQERGGAALPMEIPLTQIELEARKNIKLRRVGKAIRPSDSELNENIRARSATLRVGEKRV